MTLFSINTDTIWPRMLDILFCWIFYAREHEVKIVKYPTQDRSYSSGRAAQPAGGKRKGGTDPVMLDSNDGSN